MSSHEVILNEMDEARDYPLDEINHNDLMSEKYKKTCKYLNYIEHLHILALTVTSCVWISAFVGITSSAVGIEIFAISAGIKKYKSITKKKKKKHDYTVLLGINKLNTIKVLISKGLIGSSIVTVNLFQ